MSTPKDDPRVSEATGKPRGTTSAKAADKGTPRPAEAPATGARPGQARPVQAAAKRPLVPPQAGEPKPASEQADVPNGRGGVSGDGPARDGQTPPWQRGPQREPQSNLRRPGQPPMSLPPTAGASGKPLSPSNPTAADLAAKNARRQEAAVRTAAIDGPTRKVARPELAKDMPDLSEVRHPTTPAGVADTGVAAAAAVPGVATPAAVGVAAAPAGLRASVQIRKIDPWSMLKVSLVISVALFFVWMVAVGLLYLVLDGMGVWDRLNNAFTDIVSGGGSSGIISAGQVFGYSAVVGLINVVLITALATIGSFIYNQCSDLVGGVEVTLADPD